MLSLSYYHLPESIGSTYIISFSTSVHVAATAIISLQRQKVYFAAAAQFLAQAPYKFIQIFCTLGTNNFPTPRGAVWRNSELERYLSLLSSTFLIDCFTYVFAFEGCFHLHRAASYFSLRCQHAITTFIQNVVTSLRS